MDHLLDTEPPIRQKWFSKCDEDEEHCLCCKKFTKKIKKKCYFCDHKSKNQIARRIHIAEEHNNLKTNGYFRCSICSFKTKFPLMFIKHEAKPHNKYQLADSEELLQCELCSYQCDQNSKLLKHQKVHNKAPIACKQCSYETTTLIYMNKHVKKAHKDPNKVSNICQTCGFRGKRQIQYLNHSCEPLKCDLCDFESHLPIRIVLHKSKHHREPEFTQCDKCPYKSNRKSNVEHHKRTVHEGIRIECQSCDRKFTQHSDYRKHAKVVHNVEIDATRKPAGKYKCEICGYKSSNTSSVDRHQCKPLKCNLCDFESHQPSQIVVHKTKAHLRRDNMFWCDICPFKVKQKQNYKLHLKNKHNITLE